MIPQIIQTVLEFYGMTNKKFVENFKSQKQTYVECRYMIATLLREKTSMSLSEIGDIIHKDHSTTHTGIQLILTEKNLNKKYTKIKELCQ